MHSISMRITSDYIKYKIEVLNRESDLVKVQQQLPKNINSLEQLIADNKQNKELRIYAAQAYYSYAFAFIEDNDKNHATWLYSQAYHHAKKALALHGISESNLQGSTKYLRQKIRSLRIDATDALYWTAISWAKMIEIKQPSFSYLVQFHKPAILMKKVIKLDDSYQYYGPYLFFAVYHAALPFYLGGSDSTAIKYFKQASSLNHNQLRIIDFLQLKYLSGSRKKETYTQRLQKIIDAPVNKYPKHALMNAVAKKKASNLLTASQD